MLKQLTTIVLITGLLSMPAFASSDEAWKTFGAEVKQGCIKATKGIITNPKVVVDPYGTEDYGLAIVSGKSPEQHSSAIICVFDKKSKAVQIGSDLNLKVTPSL